MTVRQGDTGNTQTPLSGPDYRLLFDSAPDGIVGVCQRGAIVFANAAAAAALGYGLEEFLTLRITDIEARETRGKFERHCADVPHGERRRFETRHRRKDGSLLDVEVVLNLIERDGEVIAYSFWRNITDRKLVEKKRVQSDERLRALADALPLFLAYTDTERRYRFVNREYGRWFGMSPEAMIGKSVQEVLGEAGYTRVRNNIDQVLAGETFVVEGRMPMSNGVVMDFEATYIPHTSIEGGVKGYFLMSRDVTKSKRLEQELRVFNEIVSSMAEGVVLTSAVDGTIVYANPTFEKMFGYGPGELEGKNVTILNAPGEQRPAALYERLQAQLAATGAWSGVMRNIKRDGTVFWSSVSITTLEHQRYGMVRVGVNQDITARILAEEEIRRVNMDLENRISERTADLEAANKSLRETLERNLMSEVALRLEKNKTEAIFMAMGDGVTVHGRDFTILFQNDRQRAMRGDHVGEKCHLAYEGRERICDDCPLEQAFLDGATHTSERRNLIDGVERFFEITSSPVTLAGEPIVMGIEIVREVTDRKKADRAIQESEQRFRSLFETMKDGVCITSTDGRIILTNPAMRAMLGYSEEEASCLTMRDIHPQDALPEVCREFELHARRTQTCSRDIPVQRRDGSLFYADISTAWLDIDGVPSMGGIFRDVTQRMSHIRQVTDALQQKEVLLREVHHRVKNNLQVVASILYLQSEKLDDPEALRIFRESRDRVVAMSLVHEQLYRSENLARVDLSGYLSRLVMSLSQTGETAGRSVEMRVTTEGLPHLSLDQAVPCGLIVNELISNAVKHAFPPGGRGNIVVAAAQRSDGMIEFSVSDDGVGFRDPSMGRPDRSLGLQLVQSLAKQLHGTMEMHGGGGTRFAIRFPAAAAEESP